MTASAICFASARVFWLFSKMSTNYSADLTTRVEPCIFGSTSDCNQCGCVISSGLHRVQKVRVAGPLKVGHLVRGSMAIGSLRNRLRSKSADPSRWNCHPAQQPSPGLVQIGLDDGRRLMSQSNRRLELINLNCRVRATFPTIIWIWQTHGPIYG
jgi:hypothetical protein